MLCLPLSLVFATTCLVSLGCSASALPGLPLLWPDPCRWSPLCGANRTCISGLSSRRGSTTLPAFYLYLLLIVALAWLQFMLSLSSSLSLSLAAVVAVVVATAADKWKQRKNTHKFAHWLAALSPSLSLPSHSVSLSTIKHNKVGALPALPF